MVGFPDGASLLETKSLNIYCHNVYCLCIQQYMSLKFIAPLGHSPENPGIPPIHS